MKRETKQKQGKEGLPGKDPQSTEMEGEGDFYGEVEWVGVMVDARHG